MNTDIFLLHKLSLFLKEQSGFGRFIKRQMNFDEDWLSGFGVSPLRRRKSKGEMYRDPMKSMKKGKNVFKTSKILLSIISIKPATKALLFTYYLIG